MNTITLKTSKNEWLALGEGFLTNGSFMFKKEYLDNQKSTSDIVNMVNVCKEFIKNNGIYNTECTAPKCSQLMPNKIDGYVLNKTSVLVESKKLLLRVYRIFDDSNNEMNIYIDERYAKMFDNFKLVTENFNNKQAIKILDGVDIIGLLMPVERREFDDITV